MYVQEIATAINPSIARVSFDPLPTSQCSISGRRRAINSPCEIRYHGDLERPYGGATLVTWKPSVAISRERLTFWCHSGLLQKLLAFSGC
ncbi:hypothetical protein E1A91_A12G024900v1 [Gossypium mustelinum]|uniref:Uncharacterized protein n=1 Tax=Gossypium mustelinum TaxID=34275 RepID=A0A5D2WPG8_GOSMU|nr:hypothetical protein E1A91_A12G024900v1 [Gossypium mustelinum]